MHRALLFLFAVASGCAHHQVLDDPQSIVATIPANEYGLAVIDSPSLHRSLVREDSNKTLVDLTEHVPGIVLDIRYATTNNFLKEQLYESPRAFLRLPAANALRAVQNELRTRGLALKVFDAYRPYRVTRRMWEPIKNPDYVADPAKGSRHNRGCAVDVTLISLGDGRELPMPTGYDSFEPRAAHGFEDVPSSEKENRALLRTVMERHGFELFQSEWWHYDFKGWQSFELLDLEFEELR